MSRSNVVAALVILLVGVPPLRAQTDPIPSGTILVAGMDDDSVWLVDLPSGERRAVISTRIAPHEVAVSHDGRTAVVTNYGDRRGPGNLIQVLDVVTATVAHEIEIAGYERIHGAAFLPGDSLLVVTSERTGEVLVVALADGAIRRKLATGGRASHMLALGGRWIYTANITDGTVSRIDPAGVEATRAWPAGTRTEGVAATPDGAEGWTGSMEGGEVVGVRGADGTVVARVPGLQVPYRLAATPDGATIVVSDPEAVELVVIDRRTGSIRVRVDFRAAAASAGLAVDVSPQGFTLSPDGRWAFVSTKAVDRVAVVDLAAGRVVRFLPSGAGPDGIAFSPVRTRASGAYGADGALNGAAASMCTELTSWTASYVDSLRAARGIPGMVVGVSDGGDVFSATSGYADTAEATPLRGDDLLLAGSVGKTFFAALALELADAGTLDLDAPLTRYLGDEAWVARVPHADRMSIRHLMTHTSGLVRYEFQDAFIQDLLADPDRVWDPRDQVAYILGQDPPFAPGEGWEYSDTNYLVVGMVLERILGREAYDEIRRRILTPRGLDHVRPSTSRTIPGLVQGYGGPQNPFGGYDAMIEDGVFVFNPQFEWAGGGYAVSGEDLARWAVAYGRDLAGPRALEDGGTVSAPALGRGLEYGLGVMKRATPAGMALGHAGYFPGYLTEMWYYPEVGLGISALVNTTDFPVIGPLRAYADRVAVQARDFQDAYPACRPSGGATPG